VAHDDVERLLAEQVAVECGAEDLEEVLAGPLNERLLPLLRLAGDTGEAAGLLLLGHASPLAADRAHELTASSIERRGHLVCLPFEWRTHGYVALFNSLLGQVTARRGSSGVILSVEGMYVSRASLAVARRAAEIAARSLLSQIRAVLEHGHGAAAPYDSDRASDGIASELSPT
jgi:hypothetical protein